MTPSDRTLRARLAAHAMHSKYDSRQVSQPGRDAALARFEREVDPDGVLTDAERARRANHARKAYFTGLALKSAQARRARATGADAGPDETDAALPPSRTANEVQDPSSSPSDLGGDA